MQLGQVFLLTINFCYFFLKVLGKSKITFSFLLNTCNGKTFVNNSTVCIPHLKPARQITFLWHSIANTYRKNFMPHGNSNKQCSGIKADSTQSVNVAFIRGLYFSFFYKPGKMTVCYIPARKKYLRVLHKIFQMIKRCCQP